MNPKIKAIPVLITALVTGTAIGYKKCGTEEAASEKVTKKGNYYHKTKIDAAYEATYKVKTTITLEEKVDDDDDLEKSWFGSGTLLIDSQTKEHYIFTAEHVTGNLTYTNNNTKKTARVVKMKILVEYIEAAVFKKKEKDDLALLKLNRSPGKPFIGKIASDVEKGDYVLGIGFPKGNKEIFTARVADISEGSTFLNAYLIAGNSGGGVYVVNNKDLQLCGLVTMNDRITSLDRVREFFKGTPLEDDYL